MLSRNFSSKSDETIDVTTNKLLPVIKFVLQNNQSFKIESGDLVVSGRLNEVVLEELTNILNNLGKVSFFRVKSKIKDSLDNQYKEDIIKYSASLQLFESSIINEERSKDLRILLVDDDEDLLHALANFLKKFSPESIIVCANNGLEAIRCVSDATSPFHLIISDVQMPKITGFDLVKFIKRNNIHSDVIAFTGNNDSDETFLNSGFTRVIRKSIDILKNLDELYKIIVSYDKIIKLNSVLR